jgi:hypothetical protein
MKTNQMVTKDKKGVLSKTYKRMGSGGRADLPLAQGFSMPAINTTIGTKLPAPTKATLGTPWSPPAVTSKNTATTKAGSPFDMGSAISNGAQLGSTLLDAVAPVDAYGVRSNGAAIGGGALKGAATGAAIGSAVPVIGTAAGAIAGTVIGGVSGLLGNKSANDAKQKAITDMTSAERQAALSQGAAYITANPNARYGNLSASFYAMGGTMKGTLPQGPRLKKPMRPVQPSVRAMPSIAQVPGRQISRMATGGTIEPLSSEDVKVNGKSHANGGVKFPGKGVELEGGETVNNDFVFSKKLGFAEKHEAIAKRLGRAEKKPDTIFNRNTIEALNRQTEGLKVQQEATKAAMGIPNDLAVKANGGEIDPPLSTKFKNEWNGLTDWMAKKGYAGNPKLDVRTSSLGKDYMNQYMKEAKTTQLSPDSVTRVQQELQDYRTTALKKVKEGKAMLSDGTNENNFMTDLSPVDGWPGTKTLSRKFPAASLMKSTPKETTIKHFGVDTKAYDLATAKMANGGLFGTDPKPGPKSKKPWENISLPKSDYPTTFSYNNKPIGVIQVPAKKTTTDLGKVAKPISAKVSVAAPVNNTFTAQPFNEREGVIAANKKMEGLTSPFKSILKNQQLPELDQTPRAVKKVTGSVGQQITDGLEKINPFLPNITNAFQKLPLPPKVKMEDEIAPNLVDFSNARAEAVRATRGADKAAAQNLNSGAAVSATKAANLVAQDRAINEVNEQENVQNTGIKNQNAQFNAGVRSRNAGLQNQYNTQLVERQLKQQELTSQNLASVSEKIQAMGRDRKLFDLEGEKTIMGFLANNDSAAGYDVIRPVLEKHLNNDQLSQMDKWAANARKMSAEDRALSKKEADARIEAIKKASPLKGDFDKTSAQVAGKLSNVLDLKEYNALQKTTTKKKD